MARYLAILLLCSFYSIGTSICYGVEEGEGHTILVLNSYHKGYEWSDQIERGIESTISLALPGADIRIEYMDTKRNSSSEYLENLSILYRGKFQNQKFDLIIGTDDHAIEFLLKFSEALFPGVPVVFCGANTADITKFQNRTNFTGVLEYADIKSTLDIALELQPDVRKVVVINDDTTTGRYIAQELQAVVPYLKHDLEIEVLPDLPISELAETIYQLPQDTIVLLLAYLRDSLGTFYEPQFTASTLSAASSVPIYSVWDFYFNFGITGGVLTSGFLQGETVAEMGLKILGGAAVTDFPIVSNGVNRMVFDYRQMASFHLPVDQLPYDAMVKNITYSDEKNILFLHSYSSDNPWTKAIIEGFDQQLFGSDLQVNYFSEFMDTKRFTDKPYIHEFTNLLAQKYGYMDLDLILVSDDNAFNLIQRQRDYLFDSVPVVFCGVNYIADHQSATSRGITGVIESYDILGTVKMGLSFFPETESIYVINDLSTTGRSNRQRFEEIADQLGGIRIHHSGSISMQQLQKTVAGLDEKTLVLLMSFTTDRDNQRFSYQQSAKIITSISAVPVFSFWDFYLGNGIFGGVITKGYDQGQTAGVLAHSILAGTRAEDLPIREQSPVSSVIDFEVADRFGISLESIPAEIQLLNRPDSLFDKYRGILYFALWMLGVLFCIVVLQAAKILLQQKHQNALRIKAETDHMTGVNNRNYFDKNIEKIIASANETGKAFTLCYLDLDNLKEINDNHGHKSGDEYIRLAVESIRSQMRSSDLLCRVGGDEFIAILHDCAAIKGSAFCRRAEEELVLQLEQRGHKWRVGISCGFSEYNPIQPVSVHRLVEVADQMMYQYKLERKKRRD